MAKVAFGKLGLVNNKTTKTFHYNGQEIEVKQYLPVNDKLALISRIINLSADENNFANPLKVSVFAVLEIVETYTNLTITAKQKEDPCKLYDLLVGNEFAASIMKLIPEVELGELLTGIDDTINAVYAYRNSVMGILDIVQQDYSDMELNAEVIHSALSDPNSLALLKNVVTKLG